MNGLWLALLLIVATFLVAVILFFYFYGSSPETIDMNYVITHFTRSTQTNFFCLNLSERVVYRPGNLTVTILNNCRQYGSNINIGGIK